MKKVVKALLMWFFLIAGAVGGIYVGGWVLFIQPIIGVCKALDAGVLTATIVGVAMLKCIFATSVGAGIFFIGWFLAWIVGKIK